MQQLTPTATVTGLVVQANIVRELTSFRTVSSFASSFAGDYAMCVVTYSDANRYVNAALLPSVMDLLILFCGKTSIFHLITWLSHKLTLPVCYIDADNILACAKSRTQGKIITALLYYCLTIMFFVLFCSTVKTYLTGC